MQEDVLNVGSVGFYRPDPSGPKSPSVVRAIEGERLRVFELPTGLEFEIDALDWMSLADMESETMQLAASGDDRDHRRVVGRIASLAQAARYLQRIVRARSITRAAGYRVEFGTEGELRGRWWWTLCRPGWADVEVSAGEFEMEDEAWLDALRAYEEERAAQAA